MFPDLTRDDVFRLETKRLWLRWPRASDSAAITAFVSLAEVAQMTAAIPHPYPPKGAERFIFKARAENAEGSALHLAITRKSGLRPVFGLVSAAANGEKEAEIGYAIAPDMWGNGFATEAVRMMIDTLFALTPAVRILANSRVSNPASRRVLEKAGFAFVDSGLDWLGARGGLHPCDRFRLDRADYLQEGKRRLPPMAPQRHDADTVTAAPVADRTGELHDH